MTIKIININTTKSSPIYPLQAFQLFGMNAHLEDEQDTPTYTTFKSKYHNKPLDPDDPKVAHMKTYVAKTPTKAHALLLELNGGQALRYHQFIGAYPEYELFRVYGQGQLVGFVICH